MNPKSVQFVCPSLLLIVLLLGACNNLVTSPETLETQSAESIWLNFPSSFDLNSEVVSFTGRVHLVAQCFSRDLIPTDPCRFQTNLVGVWGMGQDTGAVYRFTGASLYTSTLLPPNRYAFTAEYWIPTDPCKCGVMLSFLVQLDDAGRILQAEVSNYVP